MTTTEPQQAEQEQQWLTETWTFGGVRRGKKQAKVHVWYNADRKRMVFDPAKGTRRGYITGGTYQVGYQRHDDGSMSLRGGSRPYKGMHEDTEWVTELEAAERAEAALIALEAREARDGGSKELLALLEPLEAIAAKMVDPAQVDALCMLVNRRLQTARLRKARRRP